METTFTPLAKRAAAALASGVLVAGTIGAFVGNDEADAPATRAGHNEAIGATEELVPASGRFADGAPDSHALPGASGAASTVLARAASADKPTTSATSPTQAASSPRRVIINLPTYEGGRSPSATPPAYEGGEAPGITRDSNSLTVTFGRSGTFVPPSVDRGEMSCTEGTVKTLTSVAITRLRRAGLDVTE